MEKPRIEMHVSGESDEWAGVIVEKFEFLAEYAKKNLGFSLICGVGMNHGRNRISVFIPPTSSGNPHLAEMLSEIAECFRLMAARYKQ